MSKGRSRRQPPDPAGRGSSFGAAVLDLVRLRTVPAPVRSTGRMLAYLLSPVTGASRLAVRRQLGVHRDTIRRWIMGTQKPGKQATERIRVTYEHFWSINNPPRQSLQGIATKRLRITNTSNPDGIIIKKGRGYRVVNPVEIEPSRRRMWSRVLKSKSPQEAESAFVDGVIGPSPLPSVPEYLEFLPGDYLIEAV